MIKKLLLSAICMLSIISLTATNKQNALLKEIGKSVTNEKLVVKTKINNGFEECYKVFLFENGADKTCSQEITYLFFKDAAQYDNWKNAIKATSVDLIKDSLTIVDDDKEGLVFVYKTIPSDVTLNYNRLEELGKAFYKKIK